MRTEEFYYLQCLLQSEKRLFHGPPSLCAWLAKIAAGSVSEKEVLVDAGLYRLHSSIPKFIWRWGV